MSSDGDSAAGQHFTDAYFDTWNYADRPLGRFSMYWFARRYYAALVRRHAPPGGAERRLLEMGSGLGDLLMLLQDDFTCTGIDRIPRGIERTRRIAPRAEAVLGDAADLSGFAEHQFDAVVALHVMEHLTDPRQTIVDIARVLEPGGLLLFATPHPEYSLRRFKDRATDAIGKDQTHINCHVPAVWKAWCREAGLRVVKQFGDGLYDVPYVRVIPAKVQLAVLGVPAMVQMLTRTTFTPASLGVDHVNIVRKPG